MREIKFRIWSERFKKYLKNVPIKGIWNSNSVNLKNEILEQYTGLKDKNGVEICEGDKIKIVNNYSEASKKSSHITIVKYKGCGFVLTWSDPDGEVYNHFDSYNTPVVTFEVIGNIHEKTE